MNKYAKLLAVALLVSSVSSVFAASQGNPQPQTQGGAPGKPCCKKFKKFVKTVAYKGPLTPGKWADAQGCKGVAKYFAKHSFNVGLIRIVPVAAVAAGVVLAVRHFTAQDSNDQLGNETQEEVATEEEVA